MINKKGPERPITLRDIAREADVHPSTVSRAMRNDPHISPKVREKIDKIAKKIGYRPNPLISAFTAQVRGYRGSPHGVTIVILNCDLDKSNSLWQNLYIKGITYRAEQLGYNVEIISLSKIKYSVPRLNKILHARGIRGMVILPVPDGTDLSELNCEHLALATISYSLKNLPINKTSLDFHQCMTLTLKHLAKKGYKRIGFALADVDMLRFGERLVAAFVAWQHTLPVSKRIPVHINTHVGKHQETAQNRATGCTDYKQWLEKYKPEVVVGSSDIFYKWLLELKLKMPDDIGFSSTGILPGMPDVSGIDPKNYQIGIATTDLIIGQFHRNDYGLPDPEKIVMIEGSWVEGKTLRTMK